MTVVEVSFEERYWYPDDGGAVWLAGFQLVDAASGSFIGRDAPELAERGLRVAGVAGAARFHGEALASSELEPGSSLELRRDPGNEHDRTLSPCTRRQAVRWAGCRASSPRRSRRRSTRGGPGRPS